MGCVVVVCICGWGRGSMWVRKSVRCRLRDVNGGAEHVAVQRGPVVWRVLPGEVRRRPAVVCPRQPLRHRDGHQLLPAQHRALLLRRRLVQPPAPALRHGPARIPQDRTLPRGHCPRSLPPVRFFSTTNYHYFYHYFYLPLTTSTSTSTSTSFHSSRLKKCH